MLGVGDSVHLLQAGRPVRLSRLIGEGGQGAVFAAESELGPIAVKWYFPRSATDAQRRLIVDLIDRSAPDERFLWPTDLTERPVGPEQSELSGRVGFGYAMPLRPDQYVGLSDLLTGKADAGFSVVCRLSIELADAFLQLHSLGLCYRDISFGNVFFDPQSGRPLICDNDNVGIDGRGPTGVLGTRRFMAPEIVRGEAAPSARTDLYSLSVLLFYILMMGHPLLGRRELDHACWDDSAESVLFGREPVFVFDPDDTSNAPSPEVHAGVLRHWDLYPASLRRLFTQAFTRGIDDPANGRVRESVWRSTLSRIRDTIIDCPGCGRENFHDPTAPPTCWSCGEPLGDALWLECGETRLAVRPGVTVTSHHLQHDYDYDTVFATVVRHPRRADLRGLRNDTDEPWTALVDGEEREVEPGRSCALADGNEVRMATATITVRSSRAA